MHWNSVQFLRHLEETGNRYEVDNCWFNRQAWGDYTNYVLNAWKLYRAARDPGGLHMLILGSAKIRTDPDLIRNFGLTSGSGLEKGSEESRLVEKLEGERKDARKAPGLRDAPKVLGTGSVLNDQKWTPLLNDCFILGGAHGGHEFHLAEDDAEAWLQSGQRAKLSSAGGPALSDAAERWAGFFKARKNLLWMEAGNVPRILARELIGLGAFGYRPVFSVHQLSFEPVGGTADSATFTTYLDAIRDAHFRKGNAKLVLDAVSRFLFGRTDLF